MVPCARQYGCLLGARRCTFIACRLVFAHVDTPLGIDEANGPHGTCPTQYIRRLWLVPLWRIVGIPFQMRQKMSTVVPLSCHKLGHDQITSATCTYCMGNASIGGSWGPLQRRQTTPMIHMVVANDRAPPSSVVPQLGRGFSGFTVCTREISMHGTVVHS